MGGFSFELFRGVNPRDVDDGEIEAISAADVVGKETDGFNERQALVIADGATDFDNVNVRVGGSFSDFFLDEVRKVGNELNGFTVEATGAFSFDELFVDAARESNRVFVSFKIKEALVVAEVKVGFDAVVSDETFAVLDRV